MPKDGRGSLKKNDKGGNESRPDLKGQLNVGGVEYWLSGWVNVDDETGGKWINLRAEPKEEQRPKTEAPKTGGDDDDLPW